MRSTTTPDARPGDASPSWLAAGTTVHLHTSVRVRDRGRALIGGAPLRTMRLKPAAQARLQDRRVVVEDSASRVLAAHLVATGMASPDLTALPTVSAADITCVVPVKDRPAGLEELLSGLHGAFPVVVVDDASEEPGPIARVTRRHGAQLMRLTVNVGPAGAREAGRGTVATPYIVFVDSDVTLTPDQVLLLARHLHDPGVALVAPRILAYGLPTTRLASYEAARSSLDLGPDGGLAHPRSRIGWVPAACLMARADALGSGFDPSMRSGEDVDLVWRLIRAGHRVRYEPQVIAHHRHRGTYAAWLGRKAFYGTSAAPLAARHGHDVAPAAVSPLGVAVGLAALAQSRWSAPILVGLGAAMAARLARTLQGGSGTWPLATELTGLGLGSIAEQTTALVLRHWWPLTVVAAVVSRRARRAALVATVYDTVLEYRRRRPHLDPLSFAALRRLDDLAYGAGLWAGAIQARSARALLPRIQGMTRPG